MENQTTMSELTLQNDLIGAIAYTLTVDGKVDEIIKQNDTISTLYVEQKLLPNYT